MNCVKWVEVKYFHLCLEVTPQCTGINALPVYESNSIFDPFKLKKLRPSNDMKEWGPWGVTPLILFFGNCVEMNVKVSFSATLLWALNEYKALCSAQPVWTLWSRKKSHAFMRIRKQNLESTWLQPNHYIPPIVFYRVISHSVACYRVSKSKNISFVLGETQNYL